MNEIPEELRLFRSELREAIQRDFHRRGPRSRVLHRRSFQLAIPTLAVLGATTAALVLVLSGGTKTQSANAAILRRTLAALTPPLGTILHEQARISAPGQTAWRFELWGQADKPHAYRVIKGGREASWNGRALSFYNAASNTITTTPATGDSAALGSVAATRSHDPIDVAATLRSLVQSGEAQVAGTTTINDTKAYKLTVAQSPDAYLIGTAYVAVSDYRPLLIQTIANNETITYETYQDLPATTSNLSLLETAAQHPTAARRLAPAGANQQPVTGH